MKIYRGIGVLGVSVITTLGLIGCGPSGDQTAEVSPPAESTPITEVTPADNAAADAASDGAIAVASLKPTKDSNVSGTVTFTKEAAGVRVKASITGLTPGKHGFHVHEKGDCSAPDASSAGGHFNPTDMPHAGPDEPKRHAGDLGNITADESGKAEYETLDTQLSMDGPNSIVGRAVIVHVGEDDYKTQPTGDAGGRESCGVIEVQIEVQQGEATQPTVEAP